MVCLDNSVAIRLQHLPSDVFSPGIPNGAGDASISAFTLLNMTFERACTRKKKKKKKNERKKKESLSVRAHTQACAHTLHRGCVRARMQSPRAVVSLMFVLFTLLSQCM